MIWRTLKHLRAQWIGVLALWLVLSSGAAYAITGGKLILGKANTADQTTTLTGSQATGETLAVANTTLGQPAVSFKVYGTPAPFTVNSTGKVAKLNADLLDNLDSTSFLAANGKAVDSDKLDGLDSTAFTTGTGKNSWGGATVGFGTTSTFAGDTGSHPYTLQFLCPVSGTGNGQWQIQDPVGAPSIVVFDHKLSTSGADDMTYANPGHQYQIPLGAFADTIVLQLFWSGSKLVTTTASSIVTGGGCTVVAHVITAGS